VAKQKNEYQTLYLGTSNVPRERMQILNQNW